MSVDLKIERFGAELTNRLFVDYEVKGFVPHSLTEYSDVESELNDDISKAVKLHLTFFGSYYARIYRELYYQFRQNHTDFLTVVVEAFPHYYLGVEADEVMSKFVSSCAFVLDMCLLGFEERHSNFLDRIHLVWAMFVDSELKDEFYAAGGWPELRKYAWVFCEPAYRFAERFGLRVDLTVQSLLSFSHFKGECVGGLPMGLQWVDFVVKNPSLRFRGEEIEDLEVALNNLKEALDPFVVRETVYGVLIPEAEILGMGEKACMDALACGDFEKYPEFEEVVEKKFVQSLLMARLKDSLLNEPEDANSDDELDGGDWSVFSKPASDSLPGRGYLMRNCIEFVEPSRLLPGFTLPNGSGSSPLNAPIKETKKRFLQKKPIPETGIPARIEESPCKHPTYKLIEDLRRKYPQLDKSVSEPSGSELGVTSSLTLSKVFAVLHDSYCKPLKVVVSDDAESKPEPKSGFLSRLLRLPMKKRGKRKRNA